MPGIGAAIGAFVKETAKSVVKSQIKKALSKGFDGSNRPQKDYGKDVGVDTQQDNEPELSSNKDEMMNMEFGDPDIGGIGKMDSRITEQSQPQLSDAAKKSLIGYLESKKDQGKRITATDKRDVEKAFEKAAMNPDVEPDDLQAASDDMEEINSTPTPTPASTIPTLPPVPSNTGSDMEEVNKQLARANKLHLLSQLAAGLVSTVGGAGAFGKHAQAGSGLAAKAGAMIEKMGESSFLNKRQQIARNREAQVNASADLQIESVNRSALPFDVKQDKIRDIKRSVREEIDRIHRTTGLIGSDVDIKNIKPCGQTVAMMLRDNEIDLSDEDYKYFNEADPMEVAKGFLKLGKPWSGNELEFLHDVAKEAKGEDYAFDVKDAGIWSPETLDGYARFIKNSVYTYKPEATKIDSSIDPKQKHIGPMAQEIEKVNPACIIETPDGVKTVDTGRLSLMSAGAIGDLARLGLMQGKKINELSEQITSMKVVG